MRQLAVDEPIPELQMLTILRAPACPHMRYLSSPSSSNPALPQQRQRTFIETQRARLAQQVVLPSHLARPAEACLRRL